jgi:hypothetical protein
LEVRMLTSEEKVKEIMTKLLKAQEVGSHEFINEELIKKRLLWYEENKKKIRLEGSDVKRAYTLLLIKYL